MALRACHPVLCDIHPAEDAVRATFLVLARRASSLLAGARDPASGLADGFAPPRVNAEHRQPERKEGVAGREGANGGECRREDIHGRGHFRNAPHPD
jgi:hypothetical protein